MRLFVKNELLLSKMLLVSEFIGSLQCSAWNPILLCKKLQGLPRVISKHLRIWQNGQVKHEAKATLKRALVLKKEKTCKPSIQFSFSSVSSKQFNLSLHRTWTYKCLFKNPSCNFTGESLVTQLLYISLFQICISHTDWWQSYLNEHLLIAQIKYRPVC